MKQADRSGARRAVILEGDATSLREMKTGSSAKSIRVALSRRSAAPS